jgi:hypothetical protein
VSVVLVSFRARQTIAFYLSNRVSSLRSGASSDRPRSYRGRDCPAMRRQLENRPSLSIERRRYLSSSVRTSVPRTRTSPTESSHGSRDSISSPALNLVSAHPPMRLNCIPSTGNRCSLASTVEPPDSKLDVAPEICRAAHPARVISLLVSNPNSGVRDGTADPDSAGSKPVRWTNAIVGSNGVRSPYDWRLPTLVFHGSTCVDREISLQMLREISFQF